MFDMRYFRTIKANIIEQLCDFFIYSLLWHNIYKLKFRTWRKRKRKIS